MYFGCFDLTFHSQIHKEVQLITARGQNGTKKFKARMERAKTERATTDESVVVDVTLIEMH